MSLLIRIEQYGREPKIWSSRELYLTIGSDSNDVVGYKEIIKPYFSLFSWNDGYVLHPHVNDLEYNNSNLAINHLVNLGIGSTVQYADYKFIFLPITSSTEVIATLADEPFSNDPQSKATLVVSVLGVNRVFPLLEGAKLTLGSADDDTIKLDFSGVKAKHVEVTQSSEGTQIIPRGGEIILDDLFIKEPTVVNQTTLFTLAPSMIEIKINYDF